MRRLLEATVVAVALSACGDGGDNPSAGGSPTGVPSPAACTSQPPVAASAAGTTDLATKPVIEIPDTPPPCNLVVADVVKGTGAEAVPGKQLSVKYVGVTYADGKEFDASWGGADLPFLLGAGQVIEGWDQGVAGMREGGRRQIVIPPDLGYGPTGSGPIPPDATLVFVVDLVKVG